MTKALDPKTKKKKDLEKKRLLEKDRKKRIKEITTLIKTHGNPKKAAEALNISSQAFYERMEHLGIPRSYEKKLPGEPETIADRKKWLQTLLEFYSVPEVAVLLRTGATTIRTRMKKFKLKPKPRPNKTPVNITSAHGKCDWMVGLLKEHGTPYGVAKHLHISPQAIYERIERYKKFYNKRNSLFKWL